MKPYSFLLILMLAVCYNITAGKNENVKNKSVCTEEIGHMISLEKFKGSVLLLYFFGDNMNDWDRPIDDLNRLKGKYKDKKVHIGTLTSKTTEEIDEYMKTMDFIVYAKSIDFAVVTDSDSAKKFKVKPPYAYVIAQDGQIFWKGKSLNNISDIINEVLENPLKAKNKNENVYNEKLVGEVSRFKDTTPKLNIDDSQGMDDPGVKEGTTFYKDNLPAKVTPATEAAAFAEDTKSQIPNQRIEEYQGAPGVKETEREYEQRSIMNPNDD